ncbi:MAG: hypothetical protein AB8I08_03275 [Sandaracinaceae bacterium]
MRLWSSMVCALVMAGCSPSATLVVQLRTEMRPGIEFDRVETVLYAGQGISALDLPQSVAPALPVTESRDTFSGERVAELLDVAPGAYLVRVQLLDGQRVVGTGLAATQMADVSQLVEVFVNRQCRGVECPGATGRANEIACLGGRCVDPSCPEDPAACPAPDCSVDSDCPAGAFDCVTGRCLAGFCVLLTEDDRCGGARCALETGCMDATPDAGPGDAGIDGSVDGGTDAGPDSGPPDSGPPDSGPPEPTCFDVPRTTLNISFAPLFTTSTPPPDTWSAPSGASCPSSLGPDAPYFREEVFCNQETAPYDFSLTIVEPVGDEIASPVIWGYRGNGVTDDGACEFITRGVGSETPQILLNPGEFFTVRVGSSMTGAQGFFRATANP